jgi:hypothetical protein
MNPSEVKIIAHDFCEGYNSKDLDKSFDDFVAIVLINHTMGARLRQGKWSNFYKDFLRTCPNLKPTVKEQFGEGSRLVTHWSCTGTHTTDFLGMA